MTDGVRDVGDSNLTPKPFGLENGEYYNIK